MEGGDISNQVTPRIAVVWEGLLGTMPGKPSEAKFEVYMRWHRWKKAVNCFDLNENMVHQIWDLTWRKNFAVDVVTFLGGEHFAGALKARLEDREQLPIGHIWYEEPKNLARSLAYRPDIACVIHANHHHQFTFGSKGRYIINASAPTLLGVI